MNVVELQASDTVATAAAKVDLDRKSIVLLLGEFDRALDPQIRSICSRAIAPVATATGVLIIDNGSASGCAAAIGQVARDLDECPPVLGIVAPATNALAPNHTRLLRLPAEWPDPLKATLQIVKELAKASGGGDVPVAAVLAGGGEAEKFALVRCARRAWPVLLIRGSGGVADELCTLLESPAETDPDTREILETATLYTFPIDGDLEELKRILLGRMEVRGETLGDAWRRFDQLDAAAIHKQSLFKAMQLAILALGVAATLLAVMQSTALHFLMVLTPITISVFVAANSRFREGNKWILLRAAAEAVKREIFRYRAKAGAYSDEQCVEASRESKLASRIKDITSGLMQSEVNKSSMPTIEHPDTGRTGFLDPGDYVNERLNDQINFFTSKTVRLDRKLRRMQMGIYVAGGLGTLLAAFNGDIWVALTTAVATALTTKLETDQLENTLIQYNQALMSLRNIASWWNALSQWEKSRRRNIDLLVDQTEKVLEGEMAGWVQQMQSALDKLTEKEPQPGPQPPKAAVAGA